MRRNYIVSSKNRVAFQEYLLKSQPLLLGSQALSFDALFYKAKIEKNVDTLLSYEKATQLPLNKLKNLIQYPELFDQFVAFSKELNAYEINLDSLPTSTEIEKEIKIILKEIIQPFYLDNIPITYVQEGLTHAETTYLQKQNYPVFETQKTTPQTIEFTRALNYRQELEGAIQHILTKKLDDVVMVVPNINEAWTYLKTIFDRVNLDYTSKNSTLVDQYKYTSFLDFVLNPNLDTALELIRSGWFDFENQDTLIRYIEAYKLNFNDLYMAFNHVPNNKELWEAKDLLDAQNRIQNDVIKLHEALQKIKTQSLKENLIYGLSSLNLNHVTNIRDYIQTVIQYVNDTNIHYVYHRLKKMQSQPHIEGSIQITDYKNLPLFPVKNMIVLGLTSKNFPNIPARKGILDESYVKQIKDYPTQEKRNEFELSRLRNIFEKAENLILSYHVITYEGKALECTYDVINLVQKHNLKEHAWPLVEKDTFLVETKKLTPAIARKLYLKDGLFYTSVSALESFVNNPYQFYIEKGLKLIQPFDFSLDARIVGTISHYILEHYFNNSEEDPFLIWDTYKPIFPKNYPYLPYLIESNRQTILESINYLENMMKNNSFKLYKQELRIRNKNLFKDIVLTGFVDRIDKNNDSFMILDYKSSKQSITPNKVLEGSRLQLPIYAISLVDSLETPIFGFYYFSFNKRFTKLNKSAGFAKTKGYSAPVHATLDDFNKEFRLKGWNFIDFLETDLNPSYFSSRAFDYNTMETMIKNVVAQLKENILNGILEKSEITLIEEGGNLDV